VSDELQNDPEVRKLLTPEELLAADVHSAAASAMSGAPQEPSPSVDDLVQVLLPTKMKGPKAFGEGYCWRPQLNFVAAAVVLRRVSKWLDAGAYDVVIGERHRELLDQHLLDQRLLDQQRVRNHEYHRTTTLDGLLYHYLDLDPYQPLEGPEACFCGHFWRDDPAGLFMEILSREQDASYIEVNGLHLKALEIVLGPKDADFRDHRKVSDECARRGIHKLRENKTLWALLIKEPEFVDSLKVLDLQLE
jgi:hypothetical protein